jgi:hypothetical protein
MICGSGGRTLASTAGADVGSAVGADVSADGGTVSTAAGSAVASVGAAVEIGVGSAFEQPATLAIMSTHISNVYAIFIFIAHPPVMKPLPIPIYNGKGNENQP